MRKRRVQVLVGIVAVGMLVLTGCGSAQTAEGEAETEAAETVEQDMEETESSLSGSPELGTVTDFKTFDEVERYYRKKNDVKTYGYAYIRLAGYDKDILLITDAGLGGGDNSSHAFVYTNPTGKQVIFAGELYTGGSTYVLSTMNGVLFASGNRTYETYLLTPDGTKLMHKDYVEFNEATKRAWGYFRKNNTDKEVEKEMTEAEYNAVKSSKDNAKPIKFTKFN